MTNTIETASELRLLVVINQHEALIFKSEEKGSIPDRIHLDDSRGALHHLKHIKGADKGAQLTENISYYKEIAGTLAGAEEVLLMGNGTGASSAMTHLKDFLEKHHHEFADKIVGCLTVDLEAMTEGEYLKEARAFFQNRDHGKASVAVL